jgi:RNA polymerase sigma-54 factor
MVSQIQSLQLKQSQNLVMTQAMQQSLKILQLSTLDLSNLIENELEINPLLEKESDKEEVEIEETSSKNDESLEDGENYPEAKDSFDSLSENNFSSDSGLEHDQNDNWSSSENSEIAVENNSYEFASSFASDDSAGEIIEKTYSEDVNLKDHLLNQINIDFFNSKNKIIAAHIIDMLDNSGYLSSETLSDDLKSLAEKLSCDLQDIENVILRLQKCDPMGVCSRNLKEYMKIQLNERKTLDEKLEKLVDNLELLANGEIDKLRKICGVDKDDLNEMIKEIKSLEPRPASGFSEDRVTTKHVDLILEKKNGIWHLEVNSEILPKIAVKKDYYNKIKSNKLKGDEKKYVSDSFASANFLIRAVQQRYETMLRVGEKIVAHQQEFFDKGINFLKPISMKEIAEEVELHESTIGRVVANKYISTPRGVYELKYFFSNSLSANDGGEDISTVAVKYQIKEIIDAEGKVLSDGDIALILKAKGIDIARRTVAKYREAMNIPTSAVRKRLKKVSGNG